MIPNNNYIFFYNRFIVTCNIVKSFLYASLFFAALIGSQLTFAGKKIDAEMHARIMDIVTSMTSVRNKLNCQQNIQKELNDIELTSENYKALNNLSEAVWALTVVRGGKESLIKAIFNLKRVEFLVSGAHQERFNRELELNESQLIEIEKKIKKEKRKKKEARKERHEKIKARLKRVHKNNSNKKIFFPCSFKGNGIVKRKLDDATKLAKEVSNIARTLKLYLAIDQDAQEQLLSLQGEDQPKKYVTTEADNQITGSELYYNDLVCPDIWDGESLNEEISCKLFLIHSFFIKELKEYVNIVDVVLIGSLAGYTYTQSSELDVCLIYNFLNNKEYASSIKKNIKSIVCHWYIVSNVVWNGHEVNVLIQVGNDSSGMVSSGEYSLFKKQWMKKSTCDSPVINLSDVQTKYYEFVNEVLCMEDMFNSVIKGGVVEP